MEVDLDRIEFDLGRFVDREEIDRVLANKGIWLSPLKLFLPAFVRFQYLKHPTDELSEKSSMHRTVIKALVKQGIDPKTLYPTGTLPVGYPQGTGTLVRKEIEKENEKENEKGNRERKKEEPIFEEIETSKIQPMTRPEVDLCLEEWKNTLTHFEINRPINQRDEIEIARAVQQYGSDWVKLALQGARKQVKGKTYDPKNFVSLRLYLHKDKIERLVNIGAGKESIEGYDWSKIFGGDAA
jgi:hypothetical protein